jgi:hypothetical protein
MFSRLYGKGDTNIQIEVIGSTIPEKKLFLPSQPWPMANGLWLPQRKGRLRNCGAAIGYRPSAIGQLNN